VETEYWVLVWDSTNGEVAERRGPYKSREEAWRALQETAKEQQKNGLECWELNSIPPGYECVDLGTQLVFWLTAEERLKGLPP
jgi:hypothetical protein